MTAESVTGDGICSDCMKLAGRNRGGPSARQYPELHWGSKVLSGLCFTNRAYRQTSGMSRLGIYLWRRAGYGDGPGAVSARRGPARSRLTLAEPPVRLPTCLRRRVSGGPPAPTRMTTLIDTRASLSPRSAIQDKREDLLTWRRERGGGNRRLRPAIRQQAETMSGTVRRQLLVLAEQFDRLADSIERPRRGGG